MKIIIVANAYQNSSTPCALRVRSWVMCFLAAGMEVVVIQNAEKKTNRGADSHAFDTEKLRIISLDCGQEYWYRKVVFLKKNPLTLPFYRFVAWVYYLLTQNLLGKDLLAAFKSASVLDFWAAKTDVVLSTSPSFTTVFLARHIQKKYACRWIADYRDAWVSAENKHNETHFSRQLYDKINVRLEQKLMRHAHFLTAVSQGMVDELRKRLPKKQVFLIENGYDDVLETINFDGSDAAVFRVSYLGSLYADLAWEQIFFEGFKGFLNQFPDAWVAFYFIGTDPKFILPLMENRYSFAQKYVHVLSWLPLVDTLPYLQKTHLLLHISYGQAKGLRTTKTYTYLKVQKPIVFINPDGSESQKLIEAYDAGFFAEKSADLTAVLVLFYQQFLERRAIKLDNDSKDFAPLSRVYQAQKMLELIISLP